MINAQNNQYAEWKIEIAKRIAFAVISYQACVPFEKLWDQYAHQGEDGGTYWLLTAKKIGEDIPHHLI